MKLTRRNALIGLGSLVAGSGALVGTGAFSSVEADRTVNINTSGDSSAQLGIGAGSGATSIVGTETDDGVDQFKLEQTDLNADALTTFSDAVEVSNNGNSEVGFYISSATGLGDSATLDIEQDGTSVVGSNNAVSLTTSTPIDLDVVVDLQGTNEVGDIPSTITFVADTAEVPSP